MKIAVYTIALNEEQFVERWYNANKEADYLLIADTGSTDNTVEKAKALGINVVSISIKPWRFDDARNTALALLPDDIDYCISVDMDEMLMPGWRPIMETATTTRPRYLYTWSWQPNGKPGVQFAGDHIHKRHNYRWRHPVHESLYPDRIQETQEQLALEIHHHPDNTKSRGQYLPLLALAVEEDPMGDRNAYYYARELFFHQQYDKAKEAFKNFLALPTATWDAERSAAYRNMANCCAGDERVQWLVKAHEECPRLREPLVELANYYYKEQSWDKVLEYAEKALAITEKPLEYLNEPWAWNFWPWDLAAIAAYNLGIKDKALEYGQKASALDSSDARLQSNLVFYNRM